MRSSVTAAEANLARLNQIKTYQTVRAPFDGVITLRNVDTGALVNEGSTLLFRVAQTGTLRTYINLPQTDAESVKPGPARHHLDRRDRRPQVRRSRHSYFQCARPRHSHPPD
jgi:multidrug efflux pump subunit AcrA (membrane-fusion protein)